ncbi:ABC transporter ATP-binding protein/permease [Candidatus Parcubacteria bacterium]|nr:ABC transporter ATP-binding protein/permease [Candidatus Parcubacteria bacterium]
MKGTLANFRKGADLLRPFRKQFAVVSAYVFVHQLAWLAVSYVFGKLINQVAAHESMRNSILLATLTFLLAVGITVLGLFRGLYQERHVDYAVEKYLVGKTMEKVLGLSIGQHRSQNSGITQSVVNKGKSALENAVFLFLYTILPNAAEVLLTLALLIWFNLYAGLFVFVMTGVFIRMVYVATKKFYPDLKAFNDLGDATNKSYSEIVGNMQLVQVNAQERRVHSEHDIRLETWSTKGLQVWIPYIYGSVPRNLVVFAMRYLVLVYGIILVYRREYKVGDLTILYAWTSQVSFQLWNVAPLYRQWLGYWAQIKKLFAIFDVIPAVRVVDNPIPVNRLEGKVEFRNVTFTYPNLRYIEEEVDMPKKEAKPLLPALIDVSFTIEAGERIAFVGPSGAGKSTLITLLYRGYDPDHGQIIIDDGDLRLLDLKRFRESIGLVEQEVKLFDSTLRYNMLFSLNGEARHVTEDEMQRLARISRISEFEHRLTEGWDTKIGQNGVKLSGGEKQRVGIARALVKDPRLLILDEATSSLDGENERFIKDAVHDASAGRTTIVIAHRLSTVRDADRIYVMDKGSIVAEGRHEELCDKSPVYRRLVNSQLFAI